MPTVNAGRQPISWVDRLYTLSQNIVEKNWLGSQLLKHWRTHTLRFCRKPNPISIRWAGHQNPNQILLHYRSILCFNTLVGSVRYLVTLLKTSLFFYIDEQFPISVHCWVVPNPNTMFRYTQLFTLLRSTLTPWIAEFYPILTNCWGIPNINTLLSYTLS